jgi:hypothetical protein
MSHYGKGEISADFPGLARRKRQFETPAIKQIYATGCSGNIVAGKYNTGSPEQRAVLAQRLYAGMKAAWADTKRHPVKRFDLRVVSLRLEPRDDAGFTVHDLEHKLAVESDPFRQCLAAMGLSWRRPIQIPAIDFGVAQLLLLPGEAYVEYQLAAQQMLPDSFVCVAGYGDGATGYIATEKHFAESDSNLLEVASRGCLTPSAKRWFQTEVETRRAPNEARNSLGHQSACPYVRLAIAFQ